MSEAPVTITLDYDPTPFLRAMAHAHALLEQRAREIGSHLKRIADVMQEFYVPVRRDPFASRRVATVSRR